MSIFTVVVKMKLNIKEMNTHKIVNPNKDFFVG